MGRDCEVHKKTGCAHLIEQVVAHPLEGGVLHRAELDDDGARPDGEALVALSRENYELAVDHSLLHREDKLL